MSDPLKSAKPVSICLHPVVPATHSCHGRKALYKSCGARGNTIVWLGETVAATCNSQALERLAVDAESNRIERHCGCSNPTVRAVNSAPTPACDSSLSEPNEAQARRASFYSTSASCDSKRSVKWWGPRSGLHMQSCSDPRGDSELVVGIVHLVVLGLELLDQDCDLTVR